ncbi:putative mitochondrial carrier family [Tribonema minus]|uniref:Putative mitochondrial carrier family n=1 Tax=Tribonema minus TaxID=303371 RepID=A0A835ZDW2_9STRA|nr:putative mitochondrial carrier family [Tribonema minus]
MTSPTQYDMRRTAARIRPPDSAPNLQRPSRARRDSDRAASAVVLRAAPAPRTLVATSAAAGAKQETPLGKFLISASVSWVFEALGGHYLEFLKIVKQTKPGSYAALTREMVAQKGIVGLWDGFFPWGSLQMVAQKGIVGLWDGFFPWGSLQMLNGRAVGLWDGFFPWGSLHAVCKGGVFGAGHTFAKGQLKPFMEKGYIGNGTWEVASGGIGGGIQGLILSPTLLLKTRVMTDPVFRTNLSLMETTAQSFKVGMKVIRNEGALGLMKGSMVFSGKRVGDWTTRFFFAETCAEYLFKRRNPDRAMTVGEHMTSSILGGVMSALSTIPIDVMVAQIQQASKAGEKVSIMDTFRAQYREGGAQQIVGFATRGFLARATHVALVTMLMKTGASYVYEFVYGTTPTKKH